MLRIRLTTSARPGRAARAASLALATIGLTTVGVAGLARSLGAQLATRAGHGDSVSVMPGQRVDTRAFGASVAVLDSAGIAASGARTLSELLLARVSGLSVTHRGGTELDGSDVRARGISALGAAVPMLVIDGIIANGDQRADVGGTEVALSRLDDLAPADVERVEILRGPAASALYGFGAAGGAIVVTTRRGGESPLRVGASSGFGLVDLTTSFPANYQLVSSTTPGNLGYQCTLPYSSAAACPSSVLTSFNPLERASPFRTGTSRTADATAAGSVLGAQLFAGVGAERVDGVTSDDRQSRTRLRASLERTLPANLTVSATAGWVRREGRAPARGIESIGQNVLAAGMLGAATDDSLHGYAPLVRDGISTPRTTGPDAGRASGSLRLDWRPRGWLTVTALGGRDRTTQRSLSEVRTTAVGSDYGARNFATSNAHASLGTAHLGAEARWSLGAARLTTLLAYDDIRTRIDQIDSTGSSGYFLNNPDFGSYSYMTRWLRGRADARDATVRQHAELGPLAVDGGARWSTAHGLSAPRGTDAARNASASYSLPALPGGALVRLRAALGVSPLAPPRGIARLGDESNYTFGNGYGYGYGYPSYVFEHPRLAEREAGLDVAVGSHTSVALSYYRSQSNDESFGALGGVNYFIPVWGDVRSRGFEGRVATRLLGAPGLAWDVALTATTLSSRISASNYAFRTNNTGVGVGDMLQGYWGFPTSWNDANGDGVATNDELTRADTAEYIGPSLPTLEAGAQTTLAIGRRLVLSALLDYRGGQYRANGDERYRCARLRCRGASDQSAPAAERVDAAALMRFGGQDFTSAFTEPASYLRLREVVVDWDVPALARVARLQRVGVRVVGQNLATFTRYHGLDPEVGTGASGTALEAAQERFESPLARRVRLELRVGTDLGR